MPAVTTKPGTIAKMAPEPELSMTTEELRELATQLREAACNDCGKLGSGDWGIVYVYADSCRKRKVCWYCLGCGQCGKHEHGDWGAFGKITQGKKESMLGLQATSKREMFNETYSCVRFLTSHWVGQGYYTCAVLGVLLSSSNTRVYLCVLFHLR